MRLSWSKAIVTVCALLLLAVAGVWLSVAMPQSAYAETNLTISGISGTIRVYGETYPKVMEGGRIYGTIVGTQFTASVNTSDGYYILAEDILVAAEPKAGVETYPLCDAAGRIKADIGRHYLTYEDEYDGLFKFFAPLTVYDSSTLQPDSRYKIVICENGEGLSCTVNPRPVVVTLDAENSHLGNGSAGLSITTETNTNIEDDVTYIHHTYGNTYDTIRFVKAATGKYDIMSEFGDELVVSLMDGNDDKTHVGYYAATDLKMKVENGTKDVSANYTITSDKANQDNTGYGVRVVPRDVEIATIERESLYTSVSSDITQDFDGHVFTTQSFILKDVAGTLGQTLQVFLDVSATQQEGASPIDTDRADERQDVVAIGAWTLDIVGWTVANVDPESTYVPSWEDYNVKKAPEATLSITVNQRPIHLYDSLAGGVAGEDGEWIDVADSDIVISQPYGTFYTADPVQYELAIGGAKLGLTFEIEYAEDKSLKTYLEEQSLSELLLPVKYNPDGSIGGYNIIEPKVNDKRYLVEVDGSVQWKVTKRVIQYDQLAQWLSSDAYVANNQEDATADERRFAAYLQGEQLPEHAVCVAQFVYDANRTQLQTEFTFTDKGLKTEPEITQSLQADAVLPGYYKVTYANANYAMDDDVVLYVRVKPVAVAATAPQSPVYNGLAHEVTLTYDGAETNPFASEWGVQAAYFKAQRSVSPVNAGQYVASIVVQTPQEGAHNPYVVYDGEDIVFGIAAAAVTVTINESTSLQKEFSKTVKVSALAFTAQGLYGKDSVQLSCDGLVASAAPGQYPVRVAVKDGLADNYTLTLQTAAGSSDVRYTVNKIAEQTAKTYYEKVIKKAVQSIEQTKITLAALTYEKLTIQGVSYQYSSDNSNWNNVSGTVIGGLQEGTKYYLRIHIAADGDYIAAAQAVDIGMDAPVVTLLTAPILQQDLVATGAAEVKIAVRNYDQAKQYKCVVYTGEDALSDDVLDSKAVNVAFNEDAETVFAHAYEVVEGESGWILGSTPVAMQPDSAYTVVVYVTTPVAKQASQPYVVHTRAAAPAVGASDIAVSSSGITVPEGYYVYVMPVESEVQAAVVRISMEEAGVTYQMLAEANADLSEEYLQSMLANLTPNANYVVCLWSPEDETSGLCSDVVCYRFRTAVDQSNRNAYTGFTLILSRYTLVALLALGLVLFVLCAVRFSRIKKKLSGGNRS